MNREQRRTVLHGLLLALISITVGISALVKSTSNTAEATHVRTSVAVVPNGSQVLKPNGTKLTEIRLTDTPLPIGVPTNTPTATLTSLPEPIPTSTSTPLPDWQREHDYFGISAHGLIWPIFGPIASYYGPSHPLGIDIDLGYKKLSVMEKEVKAATDGTVIFAGGNECCSYGYYIVIMSGGGIETIYAHLGEIKIFQGEEVKQGYVIAQAGSTGYSTGIHLHFEVIDNGVRVNPLDYLP